MHFLYLLYILFQISTILQANQLSEAAHFYALQKAIYMPMFMAVIGGGFFLFSAWFVEADRKTAEFGAIG